MINSNSQIITNALHFRSAVKSFDQNKPLEEEHLNTILESAILAPSAYGLQPFKIIHIKDESVRAKIREEGYNQAQITDAPELFVIAVRTDLNEQFISDFVALTAKERNLNVDDLKGFKDMMVGDILGRSEEGKSKWAHRQAYIALGFMLETSAILNVDAGPMEGFNPSSVDEILGLKKLNLESIGLLALGYRSEDDTWSKMPKVRASKEDFIVKI